MEKNLYNKTSFQISLLIIISLLFVVVNIVGYSPYRKILIDGDGKGHYDFLPAIFIYNTIDFAEMVRVEQENNDLYNKPHYYVKNNGIYINKYNCGTALLILPFFLIAFFISILTGLAPDGYSILFQYGVGIAGLFYLSLGIFSSIRLIRSYNIKLSTAVITVVSGLLATNLFCYAYIQPSLSHVYSFFTISTFLFLVRYYFTDHKHKYLLLSVLFYGLTVLIRPVNALIIFIVPFLAAHPRIFITSFKYLTFKTILFAILIFIIVLSPQIIINIIQTGKIIVWSYAGEGFYFASPEITNFLFSFEKGWFIYTPFMLLIFPSLIYLYKRSKFELLTFFSFLLLLIYIFSSWWNWYYGDSFGMRPMIDFYALFFLIIAILLSRSGKLVRSIIMIFISLTIFLNLFQTYQYASGIIHPDSMNKKNYSYVFLKSGSAYKNIISGKDESYYGKLSDKPFHKAINDMEEAYKDWIILNKSYSDNAFEGKFSFKMDSINIYSPGYSLLLTDIILNNFNEDVYVIFKTNYFEPVSEAASNSLFVYNLYDKNNVLVHYKTFNLKSLLDTNYGFWRKGEIGFRLPEISESDSTIRFYIWNMDSREVLLDNMEINIYNIVTD